MSGTPIHRLIQIIDLVINQKETEIKGLSNMRKFITKTACIGEYRLYKLSNVDDVLNHTRGARSGTFIRRLMIKIQQWAMHYLRLTTNIPIGLRMFFGRSTHLVRLISKAFLAERIKSFQTTLVKIETIYGI